MEHERQWCINYPYAGGVWCIIGRGNCEDCPAPAQVAWYGKINPRWNPVIGTEETDVLLILCKSCANLREQISKKLKNLKQNKK